MVLEQHPQDLERQGPAHRPGRAGPRPPGGGQPQPPGGPGDPQRQRLFAGGAGPAPAAQEKGLTHAHTKRAIPGGPADGVGPAPAGQSRRAGRTGPGRGRRAGAAGRRGRSARLRGALRPGRGPGRRPGRSCRRPGRSPPKAGRPAGRQRPLAPGAGAQIHLPPVPGHRRGPGQDLPVRPPGDAAAAPGRDRGHVQPVGDPFRHHEAGLLPQHPGPPDRPQRPPVHGRAAGRPAGLRRRLRPGQREPNAHRQRRPGQDPRRPGGGGGRPGQGLRRHLHFQPRLLQPGRDPALRLRPRRRKGRPARDRHRGRPADPGRPGHRVQLQLCHQHPVQPAERPAGPPPAHHPHHQHHRRRPAGKTLHRKSGQPHLGLRPLPFPGRRHPPEKGDGGVSRPQTASGTNAAKHKKRHGKTEPLFSACRKSATL